MAYEPRIPLEARRVFKRTAILKPEEIEDLSNSRTVGPLQDWTVYNMNVDGENHSVPYMIKDAKLNSITIDPGNSVILNVTKLGDDPMIRIVKYLIDSLACIDVNNYRMIAFDNSLSKQNWLDKIENDFVYRLRNGKIRYLETIIIKIADSSENVAFVGLPREEEIAETKDTVIDESARKIWKKMDDIFSNTMKLAESTYQTNKIISIIIVVIGIVLLANSIGYTWYKQSADAWSIFSGGLGIVSFLSQFFVRPQKYITKALGNLAQIQMVYKAHSLEFESLSDYDWEKYKKGNRSITEVSEKNKELERATEQALKLVESYIEDKD